MRISNISFNLNQRNNVNFGKFMDDNARNTVRKALISPTIYSQDCYDGYFNNMEKFDFFEAYTDEDGIVKGRFADKFVKENTDKEITRRMNFLKKYKFLDDLSVPKNAKAVGIDIGNYPLILAGVDLSERCLSENPQRDMTEIEARDRARIEDYLAK